MCAAISYQSVNGVIMNDYDYMKIAWATRINAKCVKKLGTCLVTFDGDTIPGKNGTPQYVTECVVRYGRCPRENSLSGRDLHLCPSVHAEVEPIIECAKLGISTHGSTLYCSFGVPCKDCMKVIIQSDIERLVLTRMTFYDELSKQLLEDFKVIGELKILNVVQCPKCFSLNARKIKPHEKIYVAVGVEIDREKLLSCTDCNLTYTPVEDAVYVGD